MLGRAIAAVKQDEANALDHLNKGDDGFKDRDLYVFCANASDGIVTAHPTRKGGQLKDFPRGQEVMRTAAAGKVSEVTYQWPRPGSKCRLRNTPFSRRSGTRFAASATTSERARATSSERMGARQARALRSRDDRGHGLRHARHCLQSRCGAGSDP